MYVLGISGFYHDSAAALLKDGVIVAAAQEERFTRKRHDAGFPANAVKYCLAQAGITLRQVGSIAFYDKPRLKFDRLLQTYLAFAPRGFESFRIAMPIWLKEKLFFKTMLLDELKAIDPTGDYNAPLLFTEHHFSHAASAYFPSPYSEAAVLTMDGVGEWATMSLAVGQGSDLKITKELHFPHSLGLLYSAFTYYTGFKVNSGEYKVMGLAPYGTPRYAQAILDNLIDLKDDGSFRLDMSYFDYCTGLTMTNEKFEVLFGGRPKRPEERLTQREMDLAASVQAVTEEIVRRLTASVARETGMQNLCLAGGVALNCVANGKVLREGKFKNVWVQPAAGDAGGALGAAYAAYHTKLGKPRAASGQYQDAMQGAYLGPSFSQHEIEQRLSAAGARYSVLDDQALIERCAAGLADEKALGWFQGRMEFGPRALGSRSILGDARSPKMQSVMNLKIKYRESFRPFAPSVLREDVEEWFEINVDSPYMQFVAPVAQKHRKAITAEQQALFGVDLLNVPKSDIPAVTHVDHSARIQTVHRETNARYYDLIAKFKGLTGCPVIVNTSFNVRGEPIVCTPEDAFRCFMGSEIDLLAVGNCLLRKEEQDPELKVEYAATVEKD